MSNLLARIRFILLMGLGLFLLLTAGCGRGATSRKPPIHLIPNMDTQEKYKPFRESHFFVDGSTMRPPIPGTVARGALREDDAYYTGLVGTEKYVPRIPVEVDRQLLERGQERFNIYCSPCHSRAGDGQGIILEYKFPIPPTSFHEQRIRDAEDGYLFHVITNGIRNMPPYDHQIPVADRWAIVSYIRALQRSQNADWRHIPADKRAELER